MSKLERLEQVLDAYGASPDRWPEDERAALLALVEESTGARALCDEAARLDALLDQAGEIPSPSPELAQRIVSRGPKSTQPSRVRRWAPMVPIAAAAMLALWIARDPGNRGGAPEPVPNESFEIALVDLGVYDTPTDVLLTVDGFDPLAYVPAYDCEEDGLGCLDLEVDATGTHSSLQGGSRRMRT